MEQLNTSATNHPNQIQEQSDDEINDLPLQFNFSAYSNKILINYLKFYTTFSQITSETKPIGDLQS